MPRSCCRLLVVLILAVPALAAAAPVTVFLDARGGVIAGGNDDAAAGVSLLASGGPGGQARVPAWTGGQRRWAQIVACVRDKFADFDVDIVDEPPAGGDYIRIMVGGRPSIIGQGAELGGIAPFDGSVLHGAIGYVFSAAMRNDATETCDATAHEIGHTLGLEHALACEDLMSYGQCGEKRFRTEPSPCGEVEPRTCASGEETQSSYETLARLVGLRGRGAADPGDDRGDDPGADTDPGADADGDAEAAAEPPRAPAPPPRAAGPEISMVLDGDVLPGNRWITLTVRAHAAAGLSDVVLAWVSDDARYVVSCAGRISDAPITCRRRGDTFQFRIAAGVGRRAIAAAAFDRHGGRAQTEPRVIYLQGDDEADDE